MTRIPVPAIAEIPAASKELGVMADAGRNVGAVSDAAWLRATRDGWTPEQLTESFAYFSIAVYTAYFTNFAATELDLPSIPPTEA